ncbi:MAG: hypothetical protein KAI66_12510 [Lentisphaeria bacterium]|nr:hypothetical protein [Lentisphaeria bacterium]
MKPLLRKLGVIDCDLVETTPVVFKDRLYRFEYVRERYVHNTTGDSYFRFVDHESGGASAPFAHGYHLGNVFVENDLLTVTGTNIWDGERVDLFTSGDMISWECRNALDLPGYGIFNTSLCKGEDAYVLMFEVGRPKEVAGVRFTARFAVSPDLVEWELTPPECTYSVERYTAPHALRYLDGWYYNFYLESHPGPSWDQRVVRSRDLVAWEPSPHNPVLLHGPEDKVVANPALNEAQRERIAAAVNRNNSDIDFCEFRGRTVIHYSWGNQGGTEFLAEAVFDGSEADFLRGWFDEVQDARRQ